MTAEPAAIAVVGAGVVGLCTALELIRRGQVVHLYDAEPPGSRASFGNAAYLAAEYFEPLASSEHILAAARLSFSDRAAFKVTADHWAGFVPWSLRFLREALPGRYARNREAILRLNQQSVAAWKTLLDYAQAESDLRQSGYLRLYEKPAQLDAARMAGQQMSRLGYENRLLQGDELLQTEPLLGPGVHHALYFPGAWQLGDTHQTCQHLFASFQHHGGRFEQRKVIRITPAASGVELSLQGDTHHCAGAVIAAGAWSRELLSTLGLKVPLAAERGYHLTLPQAQGRLGHMLSSVDRNVVIAPLDTGLRIVGYGEYGRLDSAPVQKRYRLLAQHLQGLLTEVDPHHASVQQWMGIRPTLPDSLPVIDLHPSDPRIGMAFGHQHLGVTHAAITARLVSELMLQGQPGKAWQPFAGNINAYRVSRFA